MFKNLRTRQTEMRECKDKSAKPAKNNHCLKGKRIKSSVAKHESHVNPTQTISSEDKEVVKIVNLIEKKLRAGKKPSIDALQMLLEFTRRIEFRDTLNRMLPSLREAYEVYWGIFNAINFRELEQARYCEQMRKRYEATRIEPHKIKTEKKPSLDYYDWNTEDHYDWVDHFEQFGPREEILSRARRKGIRKTQMSTIRA